MKRVALSSFLFLVCAAVLGGCEKSGKEKAEEEFKKTGEALGEAVGHAEKALEGAAEHVEESLEDASERAKEAAEEAAEKVEEKVEGQSMVTPDERLKQERVAVNRFESFSRRIDELEFHLGQIQDQETQAIADALHALRKQNLLLGDQLAALKLARLQYWPAMKQDVDGAFVRMTAEIREIGDAMHGLVCALHKYQGVPERPTVLAANLAE
ncbi:MAG: hypothetical protein HYZ00_11455 [Candidatus Hydrogenedentes bacterium]|nr:hypothetical protein [Candidatus Hydrogenedentota bacterium]